MRVDTLTQLSRAIEAAMEPIAYVFLIVLASMFLMAALHELRSYLRRRPARQQLLAR